MKDEANWIILKVFTILANLCLLLFTFHLHEIISYALFYISPILWAVSCSLVERKYFSDHWKRKAIIRISVVVIIQATIPNMVPSFGQEQRHFTPPLIETEKPAEPVN